MNRKLKKGSISVVYTTFLAWLVLIQFTWLTVFYLKNLSSMMVQNILTLLIVWQQLEYDISDHQGWTAPTEKQGCISCALRVLANSLRKKTKRRQYLFPASDNH
jgi:hypothetical protein